MDVHYSNVLKQAFIVSPDHLKKLVELLQKRIGKVNIRISCVDNIEREFNTVKDLVAYENSKSKRIRSICLRARSDNYSKSTIIVFRESSRLISGIWIDVTAREDVVSRLKEKVLDVLAGTRPWYDLIHRINFRIVLGSAWEIVFFMWFLSVICVLTLKFKWVPLSDSGEETVGLFASLQTSLCIAHVFCLVASFFLNKLRDFFFPPAVFTIGQEKSRFKRKEQFQWVVVIGFGVSFAAGLLLLIFK